MQADTIHLHVFPLDVDAGRIGELYAELAPDEKQRADRFLRETPGRRWIVGRAMLRRIVASHCGEGVRNIRFTLEPKGKPVLESAAASRQVHFNLSHSGGIAAVAVTGTAPVGIDIEKVRAIDDHEDISKRFFSPDEQMRISALPSSQRPRAFFEYWTRKESMIKATGEGMSALSKATLDEPAASEWQIHEFEPRPGYVGAVAIRCARVMNIERDFDDLADAG